MNTLAEWLAHAEQLHSKNIELGLGRVRAVADRMGLKFDCPVITVAGTNGKGSTCAMLESILRHAGYRTGLYSSPHLVHFEERLRLNGNAVDAAVLLPGFEAVERARGDITLTYFEFTTLAIMNCMQMAQLDVVILEVGLGGRLDAVNIVDADCAVITSIDLDHMDFSRAGPRKHRVRESRHPARWPAGDRQRPDAARERAGPCTRHRCRPLALRPRHSTSAGTSSSGAGPVAAGATPGWLPGAARCQPADQRSRLVLAALESLRPRLPINAQAVRSGFAMVELPGRFQIVPGQPALVLDVAHNAHAVAALAANLDAMGFYPTTHGVFGLMADKDLEPILARINPLIDRWYFTDLPTPRAASASDLLTRWQAQNKRTDASASSHAGPMAALDAAIAAADPADRIVVFGSFFTVGGVLEHGTPRLQARHLLPGT